MSLLVRDYTSADLPACLEVFDSNVPKYFSTEEREEFETFLKLPSCVYLVLEQSGQIVGCGGYYVHKESGRADLCWGMVRHELHGTGLGKRLLLERLVRIVQNPQATFIRLDTSQHTFGFFEKLGFVTEAITPDGYWPGLDRYDMKLSLDETARARIRERWQEMNLLVRPETPADHTAVAEVHTLAFGRPNEARLVERIRHSEHYAPALSLVAEAEEKVVGHILLSYVGLEGSHPRRVLSLAPMAVHPDLQGKKVGSALVEAGLETAERMGEPLVVVLGHRRYYPRFGFEPSVRYGILPPFPVEEEVFMVRPLSGYSPELRGQIVYPPAFAEV